jgi:hypothetical protein
MAAGIIQAFENPFDPQSPAYLDAVVEYEGKWLCEVS